jgi:hypothetical protein
MSIDWSKERIASLSTQEIQSLQENARIKGSLDIAIRCNEVLASRKPVRRTSGVRPVSPTKILEAECAKQLSDFAIYLNSKYDLSAASATAKSVGAKGFKAHQVVAKNGQAKLGGDQRTGKVAIDRYISYRVRNEPVSLTALLISADSDDQLAWQVLGSKHHFKNFKPYSELRPYTSDTAGGLYAGGAGFRDFALAAILFESVLAGLADPIKQ